jgi:rhodanese-related sulfurtransferase
MQYKLLKVYDLFYNINILILLNIFLIVVPMQSDQVKSISKEHLKRIIDSGERFVLLDVRSKEDFDKEHIAGAKSLPLDEVNAKAQQTLKPSDQIIVYCDSYICSASTSAYKLLMRMGFGNVRDFKGGIREWKLAGLPVESGP